MPSKLSINLNNLKYNIEKVKEKMYENQKLLVMVKADGYGSGIVKVTEFLESIGVNNFGVAYLKEAKILRKNNIKSNIIVFSGLIPSEFHEAVTVDATYSVSDIDTILKLNEEAKKINKIIKVELAIDTGMTRLGFNENEIEELIYTLNLVTNVEIDGVYTHFSCADSDDEYTKSQIELFDKIVKKLKAANINFRNVHADNSAGILRYNKREYNMVRLGISAYGYYPDSSMKGEVDLRGIFKLTAPISNVRKIEAGKAVSYNKTYITDKSIDMAVMHIGYADGLTRNLSNRLKVNINGKEVQQIGNICMDTSMIDVTGIGVKAGDIATIFDYNNNKLEEIANMTDTIVYEVITNIGKRVDREYIYE